MQVDEELAALGQPPATDEEFYGRPAVAAQGAASIDIDAHRYKSITRYTIRTVATRSRDLCIYCLSTALFVYISVYILSVGTTGVFRPASALAGPWQRQASSWRVGSWWDGGKPKER